MVSRCWARRGALTISLNTAAALGSTTGEWWPPPWDDRVGLLTLNFRHPAPAKNWVNIETRRHFHGFLSLLSSLFTKVSFNIFNISCLEKYWLFICSSLLKYIPYSMNKLNILFLKRCEGTNLQSGSCLIDKLFIAHYSSSVSYIIPMRYFIRVFILMGFEV